MNDKYAFELVNYLAIKSCIEVNKPDKIFLYINKDFSCELWKEITKHVTVIQIDNLPSLINNHYISYPQHIVDFMRISILNEIGGIYMDSDLLSLNKLKYTDSYIALAQECDNKLSNCCIIAKRNNLFLKEWINYYKSCYNSNWTDCSVEYPYNLSKIHTYITIIDTKYILPIWYRDYAIYTENIDVSDDFKNCGTLHLWDTELKKTSFYPKDMEYFNANNNTFTKLFKKYYIKL
jgi:hypothetical protein